MDADFEASLRVGDVTFGADDAALLVAIADHGSVNAATATLGRSRPRALDRLETLEDAFGPLVERHRGGAGGGGSRLTDRARDLLARYERLRAALSGTAGVDEAVFEGTVTERTGELGRVETPVGIVRARLVGDADVGDVVQVSVRADAVTLHAPADTPPETATSARNRFAGTVARIDRGEVVADVAIAVESDQRSGDSEADLELLALITAESIQRLSLAPEMPIVASFKATATRATPIRTASTREGN